MNEKIQYTAVVFVYENNQLNVEVETPRLNSGADAAFVDLCNRCFAVTLDDGDVIDRADLRTLADLEEMIYHEQDWELDIGTGTVDGDLQEV